MGKLAFSHYTGGCANDADNQIYLCFNALNADSSNDWKKCRVASAPLDQFKEVKESTQPHRYTRMAAGDCKLKFL